MPATEIQCHRHQFLIHLALGQIKQKLVTCLYMISARLVEQQQQQPLVTRHLSRISGVGHVERLQPVAFYPQKHIRNMGET